MTHAPRLRATFRAGAALLLAALSVLVSCVPQVVRPGPGPIGIPEATSLFGQPLYSPELPLDIRQQRERQLSEALAAYEADPNDAEAIIWYGRRLAYLGRYREAIQVFGEGIRKHPNDARMYRHRGHRYITVRRFDRAVRDLRLAARLARHRIDEIEPDGLPNARNVPLSTLQGNVYYHLGLAYYLRGEFTRAAGAFRQSLAVARNDDNIVSSTDWLYMSLRRAGRPDEAARVLEPIRREMTVIENASYHRRLLLYKGILPPDSLLTAGDGLDMATQGYGVANWHLYNGRPREAEELLWRTTAAENWAPFGYIAAEADLLRIAQNRTREPQ
jgi:tetratricopeptide (TPR) repeat protein